MASQLDEDQFPASFAVAADQALSGRFGVAGLHPVEERGAQEKTVGGIEETELPVGIVEAVGTHRHRLAEIGIAVGAEGDTGHVARGGVLPGGQPVRVHKVGGVRPASRCQPVHLHSECTGASGMGTGERCGAVVRALHHHRPHELASRIALADAEPELGRLHHRVLTGDGHLFIERILLGHDQRGEQLLGACHLTRLVGVFLVEGPAGACVDQDGRSGQNGRRVRRPDRVGCLRRHLGDRRGGSRGPLRSRGFVEGATGEKEGGDAKTGKKEFCHPGHPNNVPANHNGARLRMNAVFNPKSGLGTE